MQVANSNHLREISVFALINVVKAELIMQSEPINKWWICFFEIMINMLIGN